MAKTGKKTDIDADLIRKLADLLDEMHLNEIEYGTADWHVRVSRQGPGTAAATAAVPLHPLAEAAEEVPTPAGPPARVAEGEFPPDYPGMVTAPMVGVVYTAAEPGAPEFVKVGDTVTEGQTVLLIEAMKVFNPIKAPRAGQVARILISNGTPVEYGEPLLILA